MKHSRLAARQLRIYHRARLAGFEVGWGGDDPSDTHEFLERRWEQRAVQARAVLVRLLGARQADAFVAIVDNELDSLAYSEVDRDTDNWDELDDDAGDRDWWDEDGDEGGDR